MTLKQAISEISLRKRQNTELVQQNEALVRQADSLRHQIDQLQAVRSGKWKLHVPHKYRTLVEAGNDGLPGPYRQVRATAWISPFY